MSGSDMSPLLDSGSYSLRPVRNPLISGTLQQCGEKLLVEPDSHNSAEPSPDWRAPGSRTGQLLKVVTSLSFVSSGLDLLVAHATSVEKVLTHGNIVYETRSQSLPPLPQHSTASYHRVRQRPRALPARGRF